MGDGHARPHGLILCTDSYSVVDTVRLMNVLIIKFRLECTIRAHRKNQYRIYIRQNSMALLFSIVSPHMHSSMLYKVKPLYVKRSNLEECFMLSEGVKPGSPKVLLSEASNERKNSKNLISNQINFSNRLYSTVVKQDLDNKYRLNP